MNRRLRTNTETNCSSFNMSTFTKVILLQQQWCRSTQSLDYFNARHLSADRIPLNPSTAVEFLCQDFGSIWRIRRQCRPPSRHRCHWRTSCATVVTKKCRSGGGDGRTHRWHWRWRQQLWRVQRIDNALAPREATRDGNTRTRYGHLHVQWQEWIQVLNITLLPLNQSMTLCNQ